MKEPSQVHLYGEFPQNEFEDEEDCHELDIESSPPEPERIEESQDEVYRNAGPWNHQWTSENLSR